MKNFNRLIYPFLFLTSILFSVGCSAPDADEEALTGLESNLEASHKDASISAKAKYYTAELSALNNSGVSGTAELYLMGDQLTVKIDATGLEPNMPHPQHIHGFKTNKQNSTCPPPSADTDGDGLVELGEGAPFYGPVLLPLYIPIDEFPVANSEGEIHYERTFTLGETEFTEEGEVISVSDLSPLQNRAIVLHGAFVEDGDDPDSDPDYNPFLPVACAQIQPAQGKNKR